MGERGDRPEPVGGSGAAATGEGPSLPVSPCKGCGAPLTWVKTANGKFMPLEPDSVGAFVIDLLLDGPEARYVGAGPEIRVPGERRYRSHFSNCPKADEFRRPR